MPRDADPADASFGLDLALDLALDPRDATRLGRLPPVAKRRSGQSRSTVLRMAWHDTPAFDLVEAGLALTEQGGQWRVERMLPGVGAWPPGAPPPAIAEGRDAASAIAALDDGAPAAGSGPLIAWVAFEGRETSWKMEAPGGEVRAALRRGVLRGVARELPCSRLALQGSEQAVLALAGEFAGEVRLQLPRATLAAEALSLAQGIAPPARRLGVPELSPSLPVGRAFAEVVGHLTEVMLYWAPLAARQEGLEPVHQMRVAVRRLRSALAIFRRAVDSPAVRGAGKGLKVLATRLGPARDWDVFLNGTGAAVAAALPDDASVQRLLGAAARRRDASYASLRSGLAEPGFRQLGIALAGLAGGTGWHAGIEEDRRQLLEEALPAFATRVLDKRAKRVLAAGEHVGALPIAALHDLRLDTKRLRYAAEFFSSLVPGKATARFIRRLSALQERLGILNDGGVAMELMQQLRSAEAGRSYAVGVVGGFVAAECRGARQRIDKAWERFRRAAPFWE